MLTSIYIRLYCLVCLFIGQGRRTINIDEQKHSCKK